MQNDRINQHLLHDDENHSLLYPDLHDRFISAGYDKLDDYFMFECWPEFLFFEENYMKMKLIINNNNLLSHGIVDIGCQFGIQSEIFLDMEYLGVESRQLPFFNHEKENVTFLSTSFPDHSIDLSDKIVISNMSLGWYGDKTDFSSHLADAEILFIATNRETLSGLRKIFPFFCVYSEMEDETFYRWVFSKKPIKVL